MSHRVAPVAAFAALGLMFAVINSAGASSPSWWVRDLAGVVVLARVFDDGDRSGIPTEAEIAGMAADFFREGLENPPRFTVRTGDKLVDWLNPEDRSFLIMVVVLNVRSAEVIAPGRSGRIGAVGLEEVRSGSPELPWGFGASLGLAETVPVQIGVSEADVKRELSRSLKKLTGDAIRNIANANYYRVKKR